MKQKLNRTELPDRTDLPFTAKIHPPQKILPKSFAQTQEHYDAIVSPFLALDSNKSAAKLPDLRNSLLYYGKNLRPDCIDDHVTLLMGFRGELVLTTTRPGEKTYLEYLNKNGSKRWAFSEQNRKTPFWIVVEPEHEGAAISFQIQDHKGNLVTEPRDLAAFTVKEYPLPLMTPITTNWTIGGEIVDHSLLHKQNAKWYGRDIFLEMYGGDAYSFTFNKERVQFESGEDAENQVYAIFIEAGTTLIFEDEQWKVTPLGNETRGKPLLQVKRVDERSIFFELWDAEGKRRFPLELAKAHEPALASQKLDIKLIGARSKTSVIMSIQGKRTQLRSDDWLIFNKMGPQVDGFEIIRTVNQIDALINGQLKGDVLILEGIDRKQRGTIVKGYLFSSSHAQVEPMYIAIQQANDKKQDSMNERQNQESDDEDEDIEEYDDEDSNQDEDTDSDDNDFEYI